MPARVPPQLEALIALAALLAPRAKKLPAELTTAFQDPKRYLASHPKEMGARGILEPTPNLPCIALIDGLRAAGVLVEVDWRSDNDELKEAIGRLVKRFRAPPDDTGDRSTAEMLELSGIELRKQGVQLAQLDFGSDSYALVVVPMAQFAEVARLAKRAKYGEAKAFGDTLEETRRARLEAKAKVRQVVVKPRAPVKYAWMGFMKGDERWFILHAKGGSSFHTRYAGPTGPRVMDCFFNKPEKAAPVASRVIAAWKKDGFRAMAKSARPKEEPPRGYRRARGSTLLVDEYPEDGRYFVSKKKGTACVLVRGDAVCVLTDFGGAHERFAIYFGAQRLPAVVARLALSYREVERRALVAARLKKRARS